MPRLAQSQVFSCLLGACLGLSWVQSAEACPIEIAGTGDRRWHEAADAASAALSEESAARCASAIVETTAAGAVLRLAARDGRLATRELNEPAELLPAVQALTVGLPEPAVAPRPVSDPARTVVRLAAGGAPAPAGDRAVAADPYTSRPIFGAGFGFRLGADRLITPVASGTISLLQSRFELGLLLRYEAHYVNSTGGNEERPETSGVVFGVQTGVHRELDVVAVRAGVLMLVAALREEGGAQRGRSEVRLGGYVGGVWPSRSKLRLRSDLAVDLVPYNVGRSETNALGESSLPWWGVSLSVGVELG